MPTPSLQIQASFLFCSVSVPFLCTPSMMRGKVFEMDESIQEDTSNPSGHTNESFLPVRYPISPNHHRLGSFGVIRRGFSNPCHLTRNHYPYPQVSQGLVGRYHRLTRSISPSINGSSTIGHMQQWRYSIPRQGGTNMAVDSNGPDCPMTTPEPSRYPSIAEPDEIEALPTGPFGVHPMLPEPGRPSDQLNVPHIPFDTFHPHVLPRDNPHSDFDVRTPPPTNPLSTTNSQMPPSLTPLTSPILTPISMISTSTIRPSPTTQEQRYSHIISLYRTCLDTSATYLSNLRRHRHISTHHYHPYSPPPPYRPHSSLTSNRQISPTLMDNVSLICTHMWRKARSDGMAPHRAEAEAVKAMRNLYAWSEVVVTAYERGGISEDVEMESGSGLSDLGGDQAVQVGIAARNICQLLKDRRSKNVCKDVLRELRDLNAAELERREGEMLSEDDVV